MSSSSGHAVRATLAALILSLAATGLARAEDFTYGIEANGVLCGYADVTTSEVIEDGDPYVLVEQRIFAMLSALGMEFNQEMEFSFHLDPDTWEFTYQESYIHQGDVEMTGSVTIEGNVARCVSLLSGDEIKVTLPDDAFLETPLYQRRLQRDFADDTVTEKTYQVLAVMESAVQLVSYTRAGEEQIERAGQTFDCVIFDTLNQVTGTKMRLWVERDDYLPIQIKAPNDRLIYLADSSIRKKIELVNVDENILTKTNVAIADVQGISYMKVQTTIEPTGLQLTVDELNVPGQRFEGTVVENRIEGVFDIEHVRYDGTGAPPYPAEYDAALKRYLEPGDIVDSDDPVLIAHATKVVEGSNDSWEAASRLSRWVAENIDYSIPGGGMPRKVFDLRTGECGGHSMLLASLCRAVGIPSRVVWGCMYTSNYGGSFGQHAWNEIYMGDAGWIPVDSTAYEVDYVDSGHIRIGEYETTSTAFNGRAMEVLDYRTMASETADDLADVAAKYADYLGEYDSPGGDDPFVVRTQDGMLLVDIPNQMSLPMDDPDENGRWACKLTPTLYLTFARGGDGDVSSMALHEIVRLQRRSKPLPTDSVDVPEDLRPYLGGYYLAALRAQFDVIWQEGGMALRNPLENRVISLSPTGDGKWIDDETKTKVLSFVTDDAGEVTALTVDVANTFERRMVPAEIPMSTGAG